MNTSRRLVVGSIAFGPPALALSSCASVSAALDKATAAAGTVLATVETDLPSAAALYQAAKGIGQVALAAMSLDPVTAPAAAAISAAIALADPVLAKVTAATSSAVAVASTAAADASTLVTQTKTIILAAGGKYTATPNT